MFTQKNIMCECIVCAIGAKLSFKNNWATDVNIFYHKVI